MSDSRRRNRLALILTPPPSLPVVQPRPQPRDSASINEEDSRPSRPSSVKTLRRSLKLFIPTPATHPLPSNPASSDLPLIVLSQTRSGSEPFMSQPLGGRPGSFEGPRSRPRITSNKEKKDTALQKPERLSSDLFLPTTNLQNNSRTFRNRREVKHRASVDVTSAMGWVTSADGAKPKQDTAPSNRSMWSHKRGQASLDSNIWDIEARFGSTNSLLDPLPEKQRVMNVRRAKKMQKVFGSEPPQSLFQISRTPPVPEVENDMDGFDDWTSASTSTVNLESLTPTTPVFPPSERQNPRFSRIKGSIIRDPPTESPPFSQVTRPHAHKSAARSGTPKPATRAETSEKEFRQRRVRAAKLSKFFGVNYNDLQSHLGPGEHGAGIRKVEVAINDRGALPWNRHEFRSLEMEDVIVRLRDLRSS